MIIPYKNLQEHKKQIHEANWRYRHAHPEKMREIYLRYYYKNREKLKLKMRERSKIRIRKQKIQVLTHYSDNPSKCACCAETYIEFLTIDHIHGGGSQHRKKTRGNLYRWLIKNNFPEGYRVLCMNCNFALGHYGYCPHRK